LKGSLNFRGFTVCANCKAELNRQDISWVYDKGAWCVWVICHKCNNGIACLGGGREIHDTQDVCDTITDGELLDLPFPDMENVEHYAE